jgi:hypothetical protein
MISNENLHLISAENMTFASAYSSTEAPPTEYPTINNTAPGTIDKIIFYQKIFESEYRGGAILPKVFWQKNLAILAHSAI